MSADIPPHDWTEIRRLQHDHNITWPEAVRLFRTMVYVQREKAARIERGEGEQR